MKPTLTILILLFLFGTGICSYAQEATTYEKSIDGTTYVFDTVKRIVENKDNKISKTYPSATHFEISIKETTSIVDEYRKVFSKQRAEELKDGVLFLTCYCDSTGLIREIRFHFRKGFGQIQLSEIKSLETYLKKYRFKLSVFYSKANESYDKPEYYDNIIMLPVIRFKDLYKDK
jgi:hypothetical protein